jgi:hypothetical protein
MQDGKLPDEDLDLILQKGFFDIEDQRFCLRTENRGLHLLPRGLTLLRVSLVMHFCDPSAADGVSSIDSYRQCALAIKHVRIWRASDDAYRARTGKVPDEAMEIAQAVVTEPIDAVYAATAKRLRKRRAAESDSNVTYVAFGKRLHATSRA